MSSHRKEVKNITLLRRNFKYTYAPNAFRLNSIIEGVSELCVSETALFREAEFMCEKISKFQFFSIMIYLLLNLKKNPFYISGVKTENVKQKFPEY